MQVGPEKKNLIETKEQQDIRDRTFIFILIAFWHKGVYQYKDFQTNHYLKI